MAMRSDLGEKLQRLADAVTHEAVLDVARKARPANLESVELFDVFRGKNVPAGQKSLAYAFTYRATDKTLTDAEVNADAGDIFSNLQIGAMLYFEAHNDHWAITSDLLYMDLKQDIEGKRGIVSGEAGAKQFVWELAGLKKLRPWLEAGIGFRIINIEYDLEMQVNASVPGGAGPRSKSISETWVDPVIIGRLKFPAKKWLFQLREDVGGFGIGSDFTWQIHPDISYRFSKLFEMSIAYRVIGIDYENGTVSDRFKYDVDTYGPEIKFGFHF
jgi:hypothetical protein